MCTLLAGGPRLRPSLVVRTLAPIVPAHGTGLSVDRFDDATGLPPRGAPV